MGNLTFQPMINLITAEVEAYVVCGETGGCESDGAALRRGAPRATGGTARRPDPEDPPHPEAVLKAALEHKFDPDLPIMLQVHDDGPGRAAMVAESLAARVASLGRRPGRLVLRVSATSESLEGGAAGAAVRELQQRGFGVALQGPVSLAALLGVRPQLLEINHEHLHSGARRPLAGNRLAVLRSFCLRTETRIVATGVSSLTDVVAVLESGVVRARGYILGVPAPTPAPLSPQTEQCLHRAVQQAGSSVLSHVTLDDLRKAITRHGMVAYHRLSA